jgi:hypothetical protein
LDSIRNPSLADSSVRLGEGGLPGDRDRRLAAVPDLHDDAGRARPYVLLGEPCELSLL